MDVILTPDGHVPQRDVADGTVQADVVVMVAVALRQMPRIFQRQGRSLPDALSFERFVPAFDSPVRLGQEGRFAKTVRSTHNVGNARRSRD